MKTFMQFVKDKMPLSIEKMSTKEVLHQLLSCQMALYVLYNGAHWKIKGKYGGHLLFERLYNDMKEEFDITAEKLIGYFGSDSLSITEGCDEVKFWLDHWTKKSEIIDQCIEAEQDYQKLVKNIYDKLQKDEDLSLGLDDFLMSSASTHETHLYLLQQSKGY